MKIGDRVYVHGHVDEIRKDTIIIRNDGGYFGTAPNEVVVSSEDIKNVVRCKDCKYFHKSEMYSYCNKINVKGKSPKETDFCSYGQRRGESDG